MALVDIAVALVRTTLATSLAALVAWGLLAALRVSSPRVHRIAWLLVIAQGWLLFPFTIEIESAAPPSEKRAAGLVPAVIAEAETIPFENELEWVQDPSTTDAATIVEPSPSQALPDPLPLAIGTWLFGAGIIVVIAAYRYLQVLHTIPLGSPPDDLQWQAEWNAASSNAKLRRRHSVELRITAALGPLLHWAPWAYFILVPRPLWSSLAVAERAAILRHELAHLRRGDLWKSLAIRVLALPQWFNPLAWFAVRRFDEAAEWACDAAAARDADDRLAFANSLLQSAEYALAPYPASAPAARGVLTRRIHRLVSPRFKEESKMKLLVVPVVLLAIGMLHAVQIEEVTAEPPTQTVEDTPPVSSAPKLPEISSPPSGLKPRELFAGVVEQLTKKPYVIESPDIVVIDSVKCRPNAEQLIYTGDTLHVQVSGAMPEQPIDNNYTVDPDGTINLGPTYGRVDVFRRNIAEAQQEVEKSLAQILEKPAATVEWSAAYLHESDSEPSFAGKQYVTSDGDVNLGYYGRVSIAGCTLEEAEKLIEERLLESFEEADIRLTMALCNSKVAYLILRESAGVDSVMRIPFGYPLTGELNVQRALQSAIYPHPIDFAATKIEVRRPASNPLKREQILPVDWEKKTARVSPTTNYPLLPGDRVFVALPAPLPAPAATPVDEARFDRELRDSKGSITLTLAVIEDANDNLAEFRSGKAKGDLIMADGKTFGAALRVLEKNSLINIADRERIACSLGDGDRHDAELPLPNPTTRLKRTQTEPTQVIVRRLGKDGYAVKLAFRQMVDGNESYQSIELAMGLGEVDVLECPNASSDATSDAKSYLLIQLAAEGDKIAVIEPSPAAAPINASFVTDQAGRQLRLEARFVPTLRNPKKPKPAK
jgi:beta-lactamase regulating signal transducer with metallopeptidase domain/protein involved in polysaccharide export with SLBB domain